jgi:hypothetical protein
MAAPSLVLGAFSLTQQDGSTRVLAEGTSRGTPVPLNVAIKTWLQDGAIVVTQGYDNREVSVRVRIFGTDWTVIAAKEALLFAELGKPNTLTWIPTSGPAAVFNVVTSSMDPDDSDDEGEGQAVPWSTYILKLTCQAFTRSAAETVTSALAATGVTTTLVNDGSATTGWTGAVNGSAATPSIVSGAVRVTNGVAVQGSVAVSATLTAAITTSSLKYLVVDWKPESNAGSPTVSASADGTGLAKLAETASPTTGYTRTWFGPVAASSIAATTITSNSNIQTTLGIGNPPAIRSLYVDNINVTDVKPSVGSGRQLLRRIVVGGSAPSPGAVAIEHASSSLGDVLAYFYPDTVGTQGYSPPLRQYLASAAGTVDSTLVSGARNNLSGGAMIFRVPPNRLPAGSYLMIARIGGTGGGGAWGANLSWNFLSAVGGTQVGPTMAFTKTIVLTSAYTMFPLCRIVLPTSDMDPSSPGYVQMSISATLTGTTTAANLDEVWLFNTSIGQLTQLSCGSAAPSSGGSANRVWMEPATVLVPRPTIRIGFASDRSDSFFPDSLASWQHPRFTPSATNVLSVTTNAQDASVTLRNWNTWHTNPAS